MNVVLIILDACRADRLGCYGHEKPTSPFVDLLAKHGLVVPKAFATAPNTTPSIGSILTGLWSTHHGTVTHGIEPTAENTLPKMLQTAGYHTYIDSGLTCLFPWFGRQFETALPWTSEEIMPIGSLVVDKLEEALPLREPFFLCLHFVDTHSPYRPPLELLQKVYYGEITDPANDSLRRYHHGPWGHQFSNYRRWYELEVTDAAYVRGLYDATILRMDGEIKRAFDLLPADTLYVITADHGEALYEHEADLYYGSPLMWNHVTLRDEILRVPLIFSGPVMPSLADSGMVSTIDIAPTILNLLDIGQPKTIDGRPIGRTGRDTIFAVSNYCTRQRAIRTETHKYIERLIPWRGRAREELYLLERDPGELVNVVDAYPQEADELNLRVRRWDREDAVLNAPPPPAIENYHQIVLEWAAGRSQEREPYTPTENEEVTERLQALGYLE